MPMKHTPEVPLALVCDLVAPPLVDRLPEERATDILGLSIPFIRLAPFEASAPAKIRLALRRLPWNDAPTGDAGETGQAGDGRP